MSLGQRIRELRQSRGLTQTQLGGSEVSKSFISLIERGRTRPSVETLRLFARRLGTSVDALLGQDGHLPETAAESILTLGREARRRREHATASRLVGAAEFLASTYGLSEAAREAKLQRAQLQLDEGNPDIAWALAVDVKTMCDETRDLWRLGRTLVLMGRVKLRTRDVLDARKLLSEAIQILKQAKASRDPTRVEALILLGTALTRIGQFEEGLLRYEEAAMSEVAKREAVLRGQAHWGIGAAQRQLGRLARARKHLVLARDAMDSAEELGDLIRIVTNIGQLDCEEGRYQEALKQFHYGLRVAERLHSSLDRGSILTEIGRVHLSAGNLDEAEHFAASALDQAREAEDPIEAAEAQVVLAHARFRQKRAAAEAIRLVEDALATFRERGLRGKVAQTAREFGLLLKERGSVAEAADFLTIALENSEASSAALVPQRPAS